MSKEKYIVVISVIVIVMFVMVSFNGNLYKNNFQNVPEIPEHSTNSSTSKYIKIDSESCNKKTIKGKTIENIFEVITASKLPRNLKIGKNVSMKNQYDYYRANVIGNKIYVHLLINTNDNPKVMSNSYIKPDYSYNEVCNVYSTGTLGWFLSFNQPATVNLIADMTSLSVLMGYLSFVLGTFGVFAGSVITFLASVILGVGSYEINALDDSGGLHGVYFEGYYGQLSSYGTPWTHPVPWWA